MSARNLSLLAYLSHTHWIVYQDVQHYRRYHVRLALVLYTPHIRDLWLVMVDERHTVWSTGLVQRLKLCVERFFETKSQRAIVFDSPIRKAVVVELLDWKG